MAKRERDKENEEHPMKGFDGSRQEVAKRLKERKREDEGNFDNLKAMFDAPIYGNIRWLHDKISRFNCQDKRILGLESKMQALFQEDEYRDFKNGGGERKKSFMDLIKECNESDDSWESLKELKVKAVNQGSKLSRLVVDLMFLNLMPLDDDMLVKMRVLGTSLKWVFQGENSVVIRRILDLMTTAEGVTTRMKDCKQARMSEAMRIEEEWFIKSRDKTEKEMTFDAACECINQEQEGLVEDEADEPMLALLKEILRLECFWARRRLPDSTILKDAIRLLEVEIKECENASKLVENKIKNLIILNAFRSAGKVLNMRETDEYRAMESMINDLWGQVEESEKRKARKDNKPI